MKSCARDGCDIEVGRGKWCSDRCRMAQSRTKPEQKVEHEQAKPEQIPKVEQKSNKPRTGTFPSHPLGLEKLPKLPDDDVISCNAEIGWAEILDMPRGRIDLAYDTWNRVGNDVPLLLRLRRAAGYFVRVA